MGVSRKQKVGWRRWKQEPRKNKFKDKREGWRRSCISALCVKLNRPDVKLDLCYVALLFSQFSTSCAALKSSYCLIWFSVGSFHRMSTMSYRLHFFSTLLWLFACLLPLFCHINHKSNADVHCNGNELYYPQWSIWKKKIALWVIEFRPHSLLT